jgi:membrane protein insertase Oxa1/YidC/SpoIIIJ
LVFFFFIFEVPTSTVVTHYESLQGGAVNNTPLWGNFLALVQWPFRGMLPEVSESWFFFGIFEVTPSTIVTDYESLHGGAVNSNPLWGIFLASVQWPFRALLPEVSEFWFFFGIFEVTTSTIVTHYESLQGDAIDGTPLWGIFLASVQWPFRAHYKEKRFLFNRNPIELC